MVNFYWEKGKDGYKISFPQIKVVPGLERFMFLIVIFRMFPASLKNWRIGWSVFKSREAVKLKLGESVIRKYERTAGFLQDQPSGRRILRLANKLCTAAIYLLYPICLILLALQQDRRFWRILLVPAVSFLLVSFFRSLINAPPAI